ncbi:MAG: lysophospholipid acyltransferase family protein [Gemmatimonadales bacterium]
MNDVPDDEGDGTPPRAAEGIGAVPPAGRLDWRSRVAVAAGTAVIRLLAATWRFRQLNYGPVGAFREQRRAAIYAFWHAQMLPFLALHRHENAAVLVSVHRDGERITHAAARFGFRAIRGSTSRGAAGALRRLVRALHDGLEVVVTPDGPRGPAEQFAAGTLIAAQQAGVPVVLMAAAAHRAWRLGSWDRFMIPKPWTRITVAYSEPMPVTGSSPREAAATAAEFQARLIALNQVAAADAAHG